MSERRLARAASRGPVNRQTGTEAMAVAAAASAASAAATATGRCARTNRAGGTRHKCSRAGMANLFERAAPVASLLALALCLAAATHTTQALAANDATHNPPQDDAPGAGGLASPGSSNFLLFSSRAQSGAGAGTGAEGERALERLLKDVNHNHAGDRVNLTLANEVWRRMRANALEFARARVRQARPEVERLLEAARVSPECKRALGATLERLSALDEWAVRMYNAFGDFPSAGLFEGSFTSMGSYHQCVNVAPNEWLGPRGAQYCSLIYQPVVPKRPVYHNILSKIDGLANFTRPQDMFHGLAQKSQYFYYTKLRFAICMPSKCSRADVEAIGEQIALNTYLQFQGAQCLEKETGFHFDGAQLLALGLLAALASVSLVGTLVHLFGVRALFDGERAAAGARGPGSALSQVPIELTTAGEKHLHLALHEAHADFGVATKNIINNNNHSNNNHNHNHENGATKNGNEGQVRGPTAAAAASATLTSPTAKPHGRHCERAADLCSVGSSSARSGRAPNRRLVRVLDVLLHFSVIKNGRKLFDTSTSRRRGNSRAGSLVPGLSEAAAAASAGNSSTATSRSDASSVDGGVGGSGATGGRSNDISCVHGLRFWTISWIIMGHTMQYTEWAGFGRAFQVEENITSLMLHPFLNATFSVDTFFLISGLLTTYVTWSITRGHYWRFNKFAFLISRYLRLLPQVLIVILIFIIYPQLGAGSSPWWRATAEKESQRCKQNWWVSALFLQSFFRSDQICNLVTWWLSVEMFYHFTSIFVIIGLLHSARRGILTAGLLGGGMTAYSCYLHYANAYPPNMLPTLLQRYEIWDSIVLKYFWTPYPHAPSYFVGLLLGYALYNRSVHSLTKRQVRYGWLAFVISYLAILFGTYHWNNNAPYSRFMATAYYNSSQVLWSLATGWAILACALGRGGWLNDFLSSPVFIPLGRATYMTYLSHMLIVMSYPAKMNLLIEPSYTVFLYIFISNLVLSYALGICLTLVYESPILHLQKLLVARMASRFNEDKAPPGRRATPAAGAGATGVHECDEDDEKAVRVSLYTQRQHQHEQEASAMQAQATTVMIDTTGCH